MAVSICYNFLRIKNWKKVSDNGSNAATPPWAVPAAFYAPDGCSRAISRPGRFFFHHCTHIGNSASGAIAASPQAGTAKPHPLVGFIFGSKGSPYILFRFRVRYSVPLEVGLFRPASPGVPSRLCDLGMAPGGSAAGETASVPYPEISRKNRTGVIPKRERGSRYGVSVPFCAAGSTTAVAALRFDRAASQLLSAGP